MPKSDEEHNVLLARLDPLSPRITLELCISRKLSPLLKFTKGNEIRGRREDFFYVFCSCKEIVNDCKHGVSVENRDNVCKCS